MMRSGLLPPALRHYSAADFSGVLLVHGQPGGTIYFTGGKVAACETPGAPGPEVILVHSRRIAAADWGAARTAATAGGQSLTTELIQRGLLGAGEAEALLRTTLADAMFALVSGQVDAWAEAPPARCLLPLTPAVRPGWLLAEAARRAQVLASFAEPDEPAEPGAPSARADERRAARELAFTSGRGLYATMLYLARARAASAAMP